MKDVEKVTGRMGRVHPEGPADGPGIDAPSVIDAASTIDGVADPMGGGGAQGTDGRFGGPDPSIEIEPSREARRTRAPEGAPDPWATLLEAGARWVGELAAAQRPPGTLLPSIERDPVTGAPSLRIPLPAPETARRLADALSVIARTLRGTPGED